MPKLYAQPYNLDARGFYFDDVEEYEEKAEGLTDAFGSPVEEFEIQFIDGETADLKLFDLMGVNQANLSTYFDTLDELFDILDEDNADALVAVLADNFHRIDANDVLHAAANCYIFQGTAEEYAEEYLDATGMFDGVHDIMRSYFDVERYARDMMLDGNLYQVNVGGRWYVVELTS